MESKSEGMLDYLLDKAAFVANALVNKRRFHKFKKNMPKDLSLLRKKDKIRCVFVVNELAIWKTEGLYQAMLKHPRFEPVICVTYSIYVTPTIVFKNHRQIIDYLNAKGYEYVETDRINKLDPDITFYGRPYEELIAPEMWYRRNKGISAYIAYGLNNLHTPKSYNLLLINYSHFFFVENNLVRQALSPLYKMRGKNMRVTGVPATDQLLSKEINCNPWKPQETEKKKIIWAPHFTIKKGCSWLNFSSFLTMWEFMIEFSEKYKAQVQFAFKPHPNLFKTLENEWGKEERDKFYDYWRTQPNTQLEEGEYMDLFKTSDAMIHDCGSFLMEYMHMNKPVLYTLRDTENLQMNEFGMMAYDNCYHGNTREIVQQFIEDVIAGRDSLKEARTEFWNKHIMPPNGKTACENIIDSILGQNGYE